MSIKSGGSNCKTQSLLIFKKILLYVLVVVVTTVVTMVCAV